MNLFYYRDQTGQAVGPLPLSEIERFVEAGVLNTDVQVREEGRHDWVSLTSVRHRENIPVATRVSDPSPTQTDPATRADLNSNRKKAAPRFKKLRNRFARRNKKELLGCIVGQIIYLTLIFLVLKVFAWLLDRFMPPIFPDGLL